MNNTTNLIKCDRTKTLRTSSNVVDHIINKLKTIFPAWRSSMPTQQEEAEIKREWAIALSENKITTREQILTGISHARRADTPFFPSCGQFISWCSPTRNRINDEAYTLYQPALPRYTRAEYDEFGKRGMNEIRKILGK